MIISQWILISVMAFGSIASLIVVVMDKLDAESDSGRKSQSQDDSVSSLVDIMEP